MVEKIKPPVDLLIANADLIDGRGELSGSRELITPDRKIQAEMAIDCLKVWEARKVICTYGTAYHTGRLEDWEVLISQALGGEIHSHPFIKIEGVTFDVKHKASRSSIPHGRGTPIAKERLWNVLWNLENERQPLADILLRSHIHYYSYIGGDGWLAMTLPALQGSTMYGAREVSGTINWGLVEFRIDGTEYEWIAHLAHLKGFKQEVIEV